MKERITVEILSEMTHDDLKSIGIFAFGDRHKIINGFRRKTNNERSNVQVTSEVPEVYNVIEEVSEEMSESVNSPVTLLRNQLQKSVEKSNYKGGNLFDGSRGMELYLTLLGDEADENPKANSTQNETLVVDGKTVSVNFVSESMRIGDISKKRKATDKNSSKTVKKMRYRLYVEE